MYLQFCVIWLLLHGVQNCLFIKFFFLFLVFLRSFLGKQTVEAETEEADYEEDNDSEEQEDGPHRHPRAVGDEVGVLVELLLHRVEDVDVSPHPQSGQPHTPVKIHRGLREQKHNLIFPQ